MKTFLTTVLAVAFIGVAIISCSTKETSTSPSPFKVIGYAQGHTIDTAVIPFSRLTHVNFSFGTPAKTIGALDTLQNADKLIGLVTKAHTQNVEVFISIGGWDVGDGGGVDTRFHSLAETASARDTFVLQTLKLVRQYNLDGVDIDWEYPDPDTHSADDYVLLMKQLADALHAENRKLTAAVVHYGHQGDGIKKEIFDIVDWLNLMAYDDDNGKPIPHSPYSLAEKSIHYWLDERGLPPAKAVLGLPFYGKPWNRISAYNLLIKAGADPMKDEFNSLYYNGIPTIQKKTILALNKGLAGVMIWEIALDTHDDSSLLKAIGDTIVKK